jgi:chitinase
MLKTNKLKSLIATALIFILASCGGGTKDSSSGNATTISPNVMHAKANSATSQSFVFGPYKDVSISANWNTFDISTAINAGSQGIAPLLSVLPPDVNTVTWAFASGDCANENWGGISPAALIAANVSAFEAADVNYIIAIGGAAGTFSCSNGTQMQAFIDRYMSPKMIGLDFDIEGGAWSNAAISGLVNSVAAAKASGKYPGLRVSFTLQTLADTTALSGTAGASINSVGAAVMAAIRTAGLTDYTINLMVMDYGSAIPSNCVVMNGRCDMGHSAIQAAENFLATFNGTGGNDLVLPSHLELTPMIGLNDTVDEVFTINDAIVVAQYAKNRGLGGLHYWSFDRDISCSYTYPSPTCSGVPNVDPLGYTTTFLNNLN